MIQRNALRSWTRLAPDVQIIVFGDEPGCESAVASIDRSCVQWHPDIPRNRWGTPLLDRAFADAAQQARHEWLLYANADILLLDNLPHALARLDLPVMLGVCERLNIDITQSIRMDGDWATALHERVHREARPHGPTGIDLFVMRRESIVPDMPSFAVGRPGWDNWMIFRARQLGWPVVNLTPSVTVVHQNHDYSHVPEARGDKWEGPEVDRNRLLTGGPYRDLTIEDATHVLTPDRLQQRDRKLNCREMAMRWLAYHPWLARLERRLRGRDVDTG